MNLEEIKSEWKKRSSFEQVLVIIGFAISVPLIIPAAVVALFFMSLGAAASFFDDVV